MIRDTYNKNYKTTQKQLKKVTSKKELPSVKGLPSRNRTVPNKNPT